MDKMLTVVETELYSKGAAKMWSAAERADIVSWLAANPLVGDVIAGTSGLRKVRVARAGMGKRGGGRIIYFVRHGDRIWLLMAYPKSQRDDLPKALYAQIVEYLNDYTKEEK